MVFDSCWVWQLKVMWPAVTIHVITADHSWEAICSKTWNIIKKCVSDHSYCQGALVCKVETCFLWTTVLLLYKICQFYRTYLLCIVHQTAQVCCLPQVPYMARCRNICAPVDSWLITHGNSGFKGLCNWAAAAALGWRKREKKVALKQLQVLTKFMLL